MPTLVIDGVEAFAYSSVEFADDYLVFDPNYAIWQALTEDDKKRNLVTASRYLDTLNWKDDWDTQEEREAESKIVQASIIIAFLIVQGEADFITTGTTTTNTKRLKAGSAEIEFFNSNSTSSIQQRMPSQLWALLQSFLKGANSNLVVGFKSYGTDKSSFNDENFGFFYE